MERSSIAVIATLLAGLRSLYGSSVEPRRRSVDVREVAAGDAVDLPGGGYYTEIVSRLLGSNGVVYAQNNAFARDNIVKGALGRRLERDGLAHVRAGAGVVHDSQPQSERTAITSMKSTMSSPGQRSCARTKPLPAVGGEGAKRWECGLSRGRLESSAVP